MSGRKVLVYRVADGRTAYFPQQWTDQRDKDPFLELAQGKALARPVDWLELARLLGALRGGSVKGIMPEV